MELYPHNELAYNKLKESLVENQRACVVQPTGTGKSFIIAKFLSDNPDKKFLCITSSSYIIEQFDSNFKKIFRNYEFIAYSTLISKRFHEFLENTYDFIILDEFHRAGAEEWGNKLDILLEFHQQSKVIGLTATHIRNDIGESGFGRDMSKELFFGNIVHYLSLREAFDVGILPVPKYIKALYELQEEYDNIINKIESSKAKNKSYLKRYVYEKKLEWEEAKGVQRILKKHIKKERNFIVFCRSVEHLNNMKSVVEGWFKESFFKNVNSFKTYANYINSEKEVKDFIYFTYNNHSDFNLIFSVEQLNEGIHIPNIDGVIFLRPTDSPIIYYQQLGRCLEPYQEQPLVFDMVNNFKVTSKQHEFLNSHYKKNIDNQRVFNDYQEFIFEFKVIDEVADYRNIFKMVEQEINQWFIRYKEFKDNLILYGFERLNISDKKWLKDTRSCFKINGLSEDKVYLLNELNPILGFKWDSDRHLERWQNKYNVFKDFILKNPLLTNVNNSNRKWLLMQKLNYEKGKLDKHKINLLDKLIPFIGFDWRLSVSAAKKLLKEEQTPKKEDTDTPLTIEELLMKKLKLKSKIEDEIKELEAKLQ